jgi:hypothetical protein
VPECPLKSQRILTQMYILYGVSDVLAVLAMLTLSRAGEQMSNGSI